MQASRREKGPGSSCGESSRRCGDLDWKKNTFSGASYVKLEEQDVACYRCCGSTLDPRGSKALLLLHLEKIRELGNCFVLQEWPNRGGSNPRMDMVSWYGCDMRR